VAGRHRTSRACRRPLDTESPSTLVLVPPHSLLTRSSRRRPRIQTMASIRSSIGARAAFRFVMIKILLEGQLAAYVNNNPFGKPIVPDHRLAMGYTSAVRFAAASNLISRRLPNTASVDSEQIVRSRGNSARDS
jgi:hypothetical protein